MYIFRVEKDGQSFYVQADMLQQYYDDGYELYGINTSQTSGGGDVNPQAGPSEYEIGDSNLTAQIAAGLAEASGSDGTSSSGAVEAEPSE